MGQLTFTVTLNFQDKITKDTEIEEVAINIAESLVHSANTCGLAPEESETYTNIISVTNSVINTTIEKKIG